MTLKVLLKFFIIILAVKSFGQVPADSLAGKYIGKYWYANPASSPWVITSDTLIVKNNIDSVNCLADIFNKHFSGNEPYYTDYFSCNGPNPINAYMKFYSLDSVRVITDNYPQPYPNPAISFRFYGKRVPGSTNVGIDEKFNWTDVVLVFPNPSNDFLFVESKIQQDNTSLILYNLQGQVCLSQPIVTSHQKIDVSRLSRGIYLAKIVGEKVNKTFKVVKE